MTFLRFLLFFCILFFPSASFPEANDPPVDLLVFSSSPGEETLGCGITIAKAIKDHQRVKVVFLTNGDNGLDSSAGFSDKESPDTPEKYIELGQRHQSEACRAAKVLGLAQKDVLFLSYPANGLKQIWEEEYNYSSSNSKFSYDLFRSPATRSKASLYKHTYGKALLGYNRENLVSDIKKIEENKGRDLVFGGIVTNVHNGKIFRDCEKKYKLRF